MGIPTAQEDRRRLLLIPISLAVAIILLGTPEGVSAEGRHVLAVFAATILSFVLRPYPMGATVLTAIAALGAGEALRYKALGTPEAAQRLAFPKLLSGYADETVWLVVAAFLLAGAMIESGLGRRIALILITRLGRSMLGLGYAICASELILGPFIPSNTARGGGLMAPLVDSIARALGSSPNNSPKRAGQALALIGAHANLIAAAMFLTGMAANPLLAKAAKDCLNVDLNWGTWALGASVPGLLSFALLPLLIFRLAPPELTDTTAARENARQELEALGPADRAQRTLAVVLGVLLLLWMTKAVHGLDTALVAWLGVLALVATEALPWDRLCKNDGAWDALIWLGGLVTLANILREEKVIAWFAEGVRGSVTSLEGWPGIVIAALLAIIYFYSMYGFSMLTGHILAFAGAFLTLAKGFDAPPLATAILFGAFSNLCGCTTNYSSGPIIIYFGLGYVDAAKWFSVGFIVSLAHIGIWLIAGGLWWRLLGWC